ncbi:uncharacterized protein LOC135377829 [Ornithodoros turicata]|uniref:uncharacterized protein LOC135377829 n=1 Tax=Ornithodoros turicata TaxID=34597 RepID=UPI0031396900
MKQSTGAWTPVSTNKFCCNVPSCLSRDGLPKPFSTRKLLMQHHIKVHAEKKFPCQKCGKGFGAGWLLKHHESTCGMSWACSCGITYYNREALLTHARRHRHTLPFKLKRGDTCRQKHACHQVVQQVVVPVPTPVIIIVQNQTPEKLLKPKDVTSKTHPWRNIIPKGQNYPSTVPSVPETIPVDHHGSAKVHQSCQTYVSCRHRRTKDSSIQASGRNDGKKDASEHADLPPKVSRRSKPARLAVQTQTCKNDINSKEPHNSTGVQKAGGCSTHTQTVESTVSKVKRTTKPRRCPSKEALAKSDKEITSSQLWNDIDTLFFNSPSSSLRDWNDYMPRSTSATQTLEQDRFFDDLCNSYGSFQSTREIEPPFSSAMLGGKSEQHSDRPFPLKSSLLAKEKESMLQALSPVSAPSLSLEETLEEVSNILSSQTQTDDILDSLLMSNVQQSGAQTDFPLFSHNETQTNDVFFECSNMFHMETQTSELLFSDLESVDIETQTPWTTEFDFNVSHLAPDVLPQQRKRRDAESQIERCQLNAAWLNSRSGKKDCINMETQTGASP